MMFNFTTHTLSEDFFGYAKSNKIVLACRLIDPKEISFWVFGKEKFSSWRQFIA